MSERPVLPHCILSHDPTVSLLEALPQVRAEIEACLAAQGGVLLRNFSVPDLDTFRHFAASFGDQLLAYEFGSTPRTALSSAGIYTSTEYPAHQHIPLHSEQSYTRAWPLRIWFHCVTPSLSGGETPIADNRAVYRRLPASIRERFSDGLIYVRNYGDFDVPWRKVFNTDDRSAVEAYCRQAGIQWQWLEDDGLRTRQHCQSVARHPRSKEWVWFNQAHLFHVSNLPAEVRESLEELLDVEGLPRNVLLADGSVIDDAMLDEIRAVYAQEQMAFPWQAGDVLMLDNMLVSHGRRPFKGARKVVVAMARLHGLDYPTE